MHYLAQNALLAELCGGLKFSTARASDSDVSVPNFFYMQQTNFEAVHHHHHHHHIALMEQ